MIFYFKPRKGPVNLGRPLTNTLQLSEVTIGVVIFFLSATSCIPIVRQCLALTDKPTTQNAVFLQRTRTKCGIIAMILIVIFLLIRQILGW